MDDKPINWEAIRIDYTTGFDGLRSIASRYNVSFRGLAEISRRDGWVDQRKAHRAKVADVALAKAVDIEVDRNTHHLTLWKKLAVSLEKIIDENNEQPDTKTLRDCVLAMTGIQGGERLALGLGSDTSKTDAQNATAEIVKALGYHIHGEAKTDTSNEA